MLTVNNPAYLDKGCLDKVQKRTHRVRFCEVLVLYLRHCLDNEVKIRRCFISFVIAQ
jgi:hypothetical protein